MRISPISTTKYRRIVVLTGAGISAASGLPTYRGPGGLWNEPDVARLSKREGFTESPEACWKFWAAVRENAQKAVPNRAHLALAEWETRLGRDQTLVLVTQNVDRLHQRAGSKKVAELHGSVFRTKCSNSECELTPFDDRDLHPGGVPRCPLCNAILRPDIVLFGEPIPADPDWIVKRALRDCDLFLAVGTSGTVAPAARFVEWAKYAGAETLLVNLEAMAPPNPAFDRECIGPAESVLPELLK